MVASAPAFAVGEATRVSNIRSFAEPAHGIIPVACNVRVTEPDIKSPILGW